MDGVALGGLAYFVSPSVALNDAVWIGGGRFDERDVGPGSTEIDADEVGHGEGRLPLGPLPVALGPAAEPARQRLADLGGVRREDGGARRGRSAARPRGIYGNERANVIATGRPPGASRRQSSARPGSPERARPVKARAVHADNEDMSTPTVPDPTPSRGGRLGLRVAGAVDWFIAVPHADRIRQLRTQLFVVFSFLVAVNAATFAVLHTVHHLEGSSWGVVWLLVAVCGASLCFPLALRAGGSEDALMPGFMAFFQTAVIGVACLDGGMDSGAVFWLVVTPIAGGFVGGARLGWAVGGASVVAGAALFGAEAAGWTFATSLSPADARLHFALNFVSAAALSAVLAALYEGPMVRHLRRISSDLVVANAALSVELAERRAAQLEAEAASRAKGALLSNMSHEFRTPLTAILGFADVLQHEAGREHQPFVAAIDRGAQRLLSTLDAVLELSWIESGDASLRRGPVAVRELAESAARSAGPSAVPVRVAGQAMADADPKAVARVLDALLSNAVRFTERGHVDVAVWEAPGAAVVEVADTGIGMSAAFVERATEPFRQASEGDARAYEGAGLGLTVADRLVAQMGGRLEIESREGDGTTVRVWLPVSDATPVPVPASPPGSIGASEPTNADNVPVPAVPLARRPRALERAEAEGRPDG